MSWLDKQVSIYKTHADNFGRAATYRDILFSDFAKDINAIVELRRLDKDDENYKTKKLDLKSSLQCYTPAALLETKKKGIVKEINRSGIMQIDFDYSGICEFDIEELKQAVFSLPFVGFCGLSCSGDGFYALALIAEPERLSDYAEHCFNVLENYGIRADKSKGKKVENLRYVSYDANMLVRENPQPLKIACFKRKEAAQKQPVANSSAIVASTSNLVASQLKMLSQVMTGQRWPTVQHVAFTLGGLKDGSLLNLINEEIMTNREFAGEEKKYLKCAEDCFRAGAEKPIN